MLVRQSAEIKGLGANIRRVSTAQQAAEALRAAILEGRLLPGTSMGEVQLAEQLEVSRNSVREAVRILEGEHLVRYELNRGTVVAELTDEDIDDLFVAREALEMAGLRALHEMTPQARSAYLEPFVLEMEAASARGDARAVAEADESFHTALVAVAASAHLMRWYVSLRNELRLALVLSEQHSAELGRAENKASREVNDHRRLTGALQRTGPAAAKVLSAHLRDGAAELHRLRRLLGQSTGSAATPANGNGNG